MRVPEDRKLNVKELAEFFAVGKRKVYQWIKQGLPYTKEAYNSRKQVFVFGLYDTIRWKQEALQKQRLLETTTCKEKDIK